MCISYCGVSREFKHDGFLVLQPFRVGPEVSVPNREFYISVLSHVSYRDQRMSLTFCIYFCRSYLCSVLFILSSTFACGLPRANFLCFHSCQLRRHHHGFSSVRRPYQTRHEALVVLERCGTKRRRSGSGSPRTSPTLRSTTIGSFAEDPHGSHPAAKLHSEARQTCRTDRCSHCP